MKKSLFYTVLYLTLILICVMGFVTYMLGHYVKMDNTAPVIYFSGQALEISTSDPHKALLQGVTASDSHDGDVTNSLVVASVQLLDSDGTIQVTYAAFDAAGNVSQAVRKAKYTDYESPRFSLTTSLSFAFNTRFDVFNIVKAEDMLDGDISHRVRITSLDNDSISAQGVHRLLLNVSNSLGDTVSLEIPLEVYATGSYDATLALTDYLVYLPHGTALDAESFLDSYTRGNATVSLKDGLPEGYVLEIESNVQPDVPGVYTIEYRVSQPSGTGSTAKAYTGYAKLIIVVEG
jgi:hypothetical protein